METAGIMRVILGLYRDDGKANGNYLFMKLLCMV